MNDRTWHYLSAGIVSAALAAALAGPFNSRALAQEKPVPPQPPAEQTPPAQPPTQPTFRTGINFVRVDVIVSDKAGNPVADLKLTDFEVLEDGKPQKVETFRLVKVDSSAPVETQRRIRSRDDEEAAAANEDARIFVFFLDDYHVRLGNSMGARKPMSDFIQNNLGPRDLVAVMYPLTPLDAVTLTRDHESVIRTVERFEGRKFNYEPRNSIEERYSLYPAETVERIRRQVTLSALEGLSVKLGALREGRKAIVFVSEGFTSVLPPQLRDPIASMPGMGNPNRRNPNAGAGNINEDRADFLGQVDIQQEMRDVFNAANRSNTAIYAVDPRGLATGEFDINENVGMTRSNDSLRQTQDTLRVLAEETDGRAIVNRNDLARAMKQIVTDSSAYYLIGYNSTQAPQDGKFHEIKVRVKRPGTQVRARKGYWALTMAEATVAAAPPKPGPPPAVNRALAGIAEAARGRLVRTWIGTAPGENGKTRVTFLWEPVPPSPGVKREAATAVSLTVAAADGETYFRGRVPETNGTAASAGPSSVTFEAPPGKLQVRMAILGGAEGAMLDNDDRELTIPDLTGPDVMLSTPRVHVARSGREYQTLSKDPNAIPTASREFRRTERLIVRALVVAPAGATLTVTSRLLNKQGQKMADVPMTAAAAGEPYVIDLPLASLPPGEYLLELSAAAEGQAAKSELIAFRVEG